MMALALLMATVLACVAWTAALLGTGEPDKLIGIPENDTLSGRGGDDRIAGRDGNDYVKGSGGTDYVRGNHGDDHVIPGPQVDAWIRGGAGNDIMETDDGEQEQVECGSGLNDQAYIDVRSVRDGFANCEYFNGKNLDDDTFDCDTWSEAPPKDQR
jgi:Ca2+-binding RTX toxin-like protein